MPWGSPVSGRGVRRGVAWLCKSRSGPSYCPRRPSPRRTSRSRRPPGPRCCSDAATTRPSSRRLPPPLYVFRVSHRFALLGESRRVAGVPGRAVFLHSQLPFVGARRRLGAFRRFRRAAEGMGRPGGGVARLVARGRVVSWSRTTDMTHNAAHGPCGRWTEYSTQYITHETVERCIDVTWAGSCSF